MTSLVSIVDQRLSRIHETGYWRVILHPAEFRPQRIATRDDCWRIVTEAQVNLRPIAYPHVDIDDRQCGDDWVQSGGDWGSEIELWRLYMGGQFVQHSSLSEDRVAPWERDSGQEAGEVVRGPRTLNIYDALFTVTEILTFAQGLAYRDMLEPSASLRVELHRMKGRRLVAPRSPWFKGEYVSSDDKICWKSEVPSIAVLATATDLALEAALFIFNMFGWRDPPRGLIEESQHRLLERRL